MEDKDKQTIKECYKKMIEIVNTNNPDFLIIPSNELNGIMKSLTYLEDSLKNAKKSRDEWKNKYLELKDLEDSKIKRKVVCVAGKFDSKSDFVLEPPCSNKCNCEVCKDSFYIKLL